jgi:oxalate decarboxylase
MANLSYRSILAATAAGSAFATVSHAVSVGIPDEPPQGAVNTQGNPASAADPEPSNPDCAEQFPGAILPPATPVGDTPMFWASFNNAPRPFQYDGWAHQVTPSESAAQTHGSSASRPSFRRSST